MAKKTANDYHKLATDRGFEWAGATCPQTTAKTTLWRCSDGHTFPRTYGNFLGPARECPVCNGGKPRLIDEFPAQVAKYFDPERNTNIEIEFLMSGSNKPIIWYCDEHDYEWPAPPYTVVNSWEGGRSGCSVCSEKVRKNSADYHALAKKRKFEWLGKDVPQDNKTMTLWRCNQKHEFESTFNQLSRTPSGCRYCAGREASNSYNLAVIHSDVAKLWHPTRNADKAPSDVVPGSHDEYWWRCPTNPELHEWPAQVKSVVRSHSEGNNGCPFCSGQTFHRDESLGTKYPALIREWHPTRNGDKTPFDFSYGSGVPCHWQCIRCNHEWKASPSQRTTQGGRGCSRCSNQTSRLEIRLYVELIAVFENVDWRRKIDKKECDLFLPGHDIGIEVDGLYWHRNRMSEDRLKNEAFERRGIKTIRVRERGLSAISDDDIFYDQAKPHLETVLSVIALISRSVPPSHQQAVRASKYLREEIYLRDEEYRKIVANLPAPPEGHSFADDWPDIAATWDNEKNAPLMPTMFTSGSNKKIIWHCGDEAHRPYRVSIKERVAAHERNGTNCRQCRDDKVWKPSPDELRNDYATMLMGEIANKYGVSRGTVRNRMKQYGIPLRPPGKNTL